MKFLILAAIVAIAFAKKEEEKSLARGFPNAIEWVSFDNAVGVAKDLNRPIFFLIHKTWCGACKGLQREFKSSPRFHELLVLSRKFVMVNVEDDDEPEDVKYAPDGGYIPRILFLDTDAEPMQTNNEQKYKNTKYFYPLIAQIIDGMERAFLEFEGLAGAEKKKPEEVQPVKTEKIEKADKKEEEEADAEETNSVTEEVVESEETAEVVEEENEEEKPKTETKKEKKEEKKEKKEEKKNETKKEEKKEKDTKKNTKKDDKKKKGDKKDEL